MSIRQLHAKYHDREDNDWFDFEEPVGRDRFAGLDIMDSEEYLKSDTFKEAVEDFEEGEDAYIKANIEWY